MNALLPHLKELGLGDYEARVYSVLLQHSPANATLIAKLCTLSRSSVYTTLNTLIGKGLVGTTYKNTIKQFVAQDETALEQLVKTQQLALQRKATSLERIREELQALRKPSLNIPQVIVFEGQEGLKKIYLSMLRQAQPNATLYLLRDEFVWQDSWQFIFEKEWHERVKRIKQEKNIQTKLLVNSSKIEKEKKMLYSKKRGLEYRFLPINNPITDYAMYLLDDTVSFLSLEKNNLVGVKITNASMAKNIQTMFELMWKASKK